MSRLIDRLNEISQAAPQPIGFRAAAGTKSAPKMLLIAGLPQTSLDSVADYLAGADAGLLPAFELGLAAKAINKASEAVSGIPWGGRLTDVGGEEINRIAEAGADFVVFPAASAVLPALQDGAVGRILEIETSLDEGLLRAVDKLPVDAVLISGTPQEGHFLTWHDLMHLQHCADLLTKPLLVSLLPGVTAAELQALWEAGVDGVVVGIGDGQPAGGLAALRQMIDSLVLPSKRRRGKTAAILPYTTRRMDRAAEEPDED